MEELNIEAVWKQFEVAMDKQKTLGVLCVTGTRDELLKKRGEVDEHCLLLREMLERVFDR